MSAGEFIDSTYQASYDGAQYHPIRIQPETLGLTVDGTANAAPTEAQTSPIVARVSNNKRQFGLRPRFLTVKYVPPNIPTGYDTRGGILRVPILTLAVYDSITKDSVINYLSQPMTVVSRSREQTGLGTEN